VEAVIDPGKTYKATLIKVNSLSKCLDLAAWCNAHAAEMLHRIEEVDPFISVDDMHFDVFGTTLKSSFKCTAGAAMCSMQACKQAVVDMFEYISDHHDFAHVPIIVPLMEDKKMITRRRVGAKIMLRAVLDRDVVGKIATTPPSPAELHTYFVQLNSVLEITAAVLLSGDKGVELYSDKEQAAIEFVRAHKALVAGDPTAIKNEVPSFR
jgi:hypothetical protein